MPFVRATIVPPPACASACLEDRQTVYVGHNVKPQ